MLQQFESPKQRDNEAEHNTISLLSGKLKKKKLKTGSTEVNELQILDKDD